MDPVLNRIVFYVLVVDDDRDDQYFLRKVISETIPQAIVESVYDGSEALHYLNTCTSYPNLVFLDLNMMRISGKETISAIRGNKCLERVPVIVLTNSRNPDEKAQLLKMGANAFYTKPPQIQELYNIVEEVRDKWLLDGEKLQAGAA